MAVRDRLILVAYKSEKAAPGTRPPRSSSDRPPFPGEACHPVGWEDSTLHGKARSDQRVFYVPGYLAVDIIEGDYHGERKEARSKYRQTGRNLPGGRSERRQTSELHNSSG